METWKLKLEGNQRSHMMVLAQLGPTLSTLKNRMLLKILIHFVLVIKSLSGSIN